MRHFPFLVSTAALVFADTGCSVFSEENSTPDNVLVNAGPGRLADFPATMMVNRSCTATKVGPRHILLAAHCVWDNSTLGLRAVYLPGAPVEFTQIEYTGGGPLREVGPFTYTVANTFVPQSWAQSCEPDEGCGLVQNTRFHPNYPSIADVALIVTTTEITQYSQAQVDIAPVVPGEALTLNGYGCTQGITSQAPEEIYLRIGGTYVLAPSGLLHPGSFVSEDKVPSVDQTYVISDGPLGNGSAGLCPGDSGGPAFRAGTLNVVGVAAYYTFSDGGNIPTTNWHTRLDQTHNQQIGPWLKSLGVKIVNSAAGSDGHPRTRGDFNGDGITDFAVWRPSSGEWFTDINQPAVARWGEPSDVPAAADYNGDGITDVAVWRPSTGDLWLYNQAPVLNWGVSGDIPVPGDYDGDGIEEFAVWRPSTGEWYRYGQAPIAIWGAPGDVPAPADYTGDGKTDVAVWRPSTGDFWLYGYDPLLNWGTVGDLPVPGDYDRDGVDEFAIWRPSTGEWWRAGQAPIATWGTSTDRPAF